MTDARDSERARDVFRLLQGAAVPVEDEAAARARRERIVPVVGEAIERAAARRQRERWVRRGGMALALAAGVALTVGLGVHSRAAGAALQGGVHGLGGAVTVVHGDAPLVVRESDAESPVAVGDLLTTPDDARAELRLTNVASVEVEAATEVGLVTPRHSMHRLHLSHGVIHARVDDRPSPTPKLIVETPDVEVVVTGTVFEVDVAPGADARPVTAVAVTKGRVVIRRAGVDVAAVTAGQRWTSETPVPPPLVAPATNPAPAAAVPAVAREAAPGSGSGARPPAAEAPPAALPGTLGEENQIFQAGVEARNHGDDAGALQRFASLLALYPGTPLGAEARVERMRAFVRLGRARDAAGEARRYIAGHPGGFAVDEARRIVAAEDRSVR